MEHYELLSKLDHFAINKWLVQAHYNNKWYTEYFALPPDGKPRHLHKDKAEAVYSVLRQIRRTMEGYVNA